MESENVFLQKFGERITNRRKVLGLSRKDLAERIGVTDDMVRLWETGANAPRMSLLPNVAEALEMKPEMLLMDVPKNDLLIHCVYGLMNELSVLMNEFPREFPGTYQLSAVYRHGISRLDASICSLRDIAKDLVEYYTHLNFEGEMFLPVGDYDAEHYEENRYDTLTSHPDDKKWERERTIAEADRVMQKELASLPEEKRPHALELMERCRKGPDFTTEEFEAMDFNDQYIVTKYGRNETLIRKKK